MADVRVQGATQLAISPWNLDTPLSRSTQFYPRGDTP